MAAAASWPHIDDTVLPKTLIDLKLIYLEPAVRYYPPGGGVLARFPVAELVEVASHWKIPQLADPAVAGDWLRVKRQVLVLGVKKGMAMRPNGRSADFIAPSLADECIVPPCAEITREQSVAWFAEYRDPLTCQRPTDRRFRSRLAR